MPSPRFSSSSGIIGILLVILGALLLVLAYSLGINGMYSFALEHPRYLGCKHEGTLKSGLNACPVPDGGDVNSSRYGIVSHCAPTSHLQSGSPTEELKILDSNDDIVGRPEAVAGHGLSEKPSSCPEENATSVSDG